MTEQCIASSWRSKPNAPYGPGGFNRCVEDQSHEHDVHEDSFGNRFVPTARGAKVVD